NPPPRARSPPASRRARRAWRSGRANSRAAARARTSRRACGRSPGNRCSRPWAPRSVAPPPCASPARSIRGTESPMRPIIGVTSDEGASEARPGRPSSKRYELKQAYADAVLAAGGLPVVLPYTDVEDALAQLAGTLSGLLVTGGAFDVSPDE